MDKVSHHVKANERTFWDIVKLQYWLKWKVHANMFAILLFIILVTLLTMFSNSISFHFGSNVLFEIVERNETMPFIGMFFTLFVIAAQLTSTKNKYMLLPFTINKRTNHVANILFMITLSSIAAILSFFISFALRFIISLQGGNEYFMQFYEVTVGDLFIGLVVSLLYILLAAALGYFIGELIYVHKAFILFLLALLFICFVPLYDVLVGEHVIAFYTQESNVLLFVIKTVITIVCLFVSAMFVGVQKEVRDQS